MAGGRAKKTARARWKRKAYLEDALYQYQTIAYEAQAAESYGPAVKALDQARAVRLELDQLRAMEAADEVPTTAEDHRSELIRDARRQRAAAEAKGSHVAASNLLKLEAELLKDLTPEDRGDGLESKDPEALFRMLLEVFLALPDILQVRLLATLKEQGSA